MAVKNKYLVSTNIENDTLTQKIKGSDQDNKSTKIRVIKEESLTIFLNNQEIVTLMCINDNPQYLAVGYFLNQNMINFNEKVKSIDYDPDLNLIVIRTNKKTN